MDVPYEEALEDQDDQGGDEDEEDVGLVVQRRDGLGGRADFAEEVELARVRASGSLRC